MSTIKTPSKSLLARLQREIVDYDEYKLNSLKHSEVDYVIDIGANIGVFSLYASEILTVKKRIICLEPQDDNFSYLQSNMSNIPNVTLYNAALGDGSDLYLTTNPKNEGMYQCVKEVVSEKVINSMTLNSILKDNGINTDDEVVLKCDCEGGEVFLMNDTIMEHMKYFLQICLEVHYGDTYFKHCPSKEEYKSWIETFTTHSVYAQDWVSDKNGHVVLIRRYDGG